MALNRRRKTIILLVLAVFLALHAALFLAGGAWKTLGYVLICVDVFSSWFLVVAIRESRKLERTDV